MLSAGRWKLLESGEGGSGVNRMSRVSEASVGVNILVFVYIWRSLFF